MNIEMADISDDEVIEKPKRVMSDKQKEALKKGRELAKANREANRPKPVETKVEEPKNEVLDKPKLKRTTKKVKEEVKPPSPEPVVKGTRVSRKPKTEEVREPSPEPVREPSPPAPKKKRTPRQKKTEAPASQPLLAPTPVRQRPSLKFV